MARREPDSVGGRPETPAELRRRAARARRLMREMGNDDAAAAQLAELAAELEARADKLEAARSEQT